jgi:hypothetical protein
LTRLAITAALCPLGGQKGLAATVKAPTSAIRCSNFYLAHISRLKPQTKVSRRHSRNVFMTVAADAAACFKDDSGERATMIFLDPSGLMIELKAFAACENASIATNRPAALSKKSRRAHKPEQDPTLKPQPATDQESCPA